MNTSHHELSPSSFPVWAKCPAFESDPAPRQDAEDGTRRHSQLEQMLNGTPPAAAVDEGVQWAAA